ncbi:hypothetical protein LUZ60_016020 [Juncus effusus]|nr:hypothetical protein LUZ60_016020 [Juncus effusus]
MDSSQQQSTNPTQRRELQGPRPTPLKVRKDSHKIKKPPIAPPAPQQAAQIPVQHKPPVIIYAVSPKVIHTNPSEFMSLVQRLTGSSSSSSSSSAPSHAPVSTATATASAFPYPTYPSFSTGSGSSLFSPAARLATIEQAQKIRTETIINNRGSEDMMLHQFGIDGGPRLNPVGLSSGILSPVPASLPAISPNIFSPLNHNQVGGLGFLHELSPAYLANRPPGESNFFAMTPGSFFANTPTSNFLSISTPPVLPSPSAYWDLFHHSHQDV